VLEARRVALDLPPMPVHCIAARQHTKVIAAVMAAQVEAGGAG
jgi:hypothetical protein